MDGVYYLQAPVFGPPPMVSDYIQSTDCAVSDLLCDQAKEAKLVWVLSGDLFAKKVVQPFLVPSMGRKVIDVGSNVERASAFKLSA